MNRFERAVDWTLARLAKVPTTQLVTVVGIGAFVGTILLWWFVALLHAVMEDYVAAWEPSVSMIGFISAWGVIAAAQFSAKRATDIDLAKARSSGDSTTTTTTAGPSTTVTEPTP